MNKFRIIAIIAAPCFAMACTPVPSAQKNGTLVKLAQSGYFFPTWEAELVRGGSYTGGTGVQGAPFDFTISDPVLLAQVKHAFESQDEVRIKYHQSTPAPFSSDSGGNFLDSIEVISAAQGGTQRGTETPATAQDPAPVAQNTDARFNQLLEQNNAILKQNQQTLNVLSKRP